MGYHHRSIKAGVLGEISKVEEEVAEFIDAQEQDNKVLQICELCDIYGALEAVAEKFGLNMNDLRKMSNATKSAFQDGER